MGHIEALLGACILALIDVYTGLKNWFVTKILEQVSKPDRKWLNWANKPKLITFIIEFIFYMIFYSITLINSSGY